MELLKKEISLLKTSSQRTVGEINELKKEIVALKSEVANLKGIIKKLGDIL